LIPLLSALLPLTPLSLSSQILQYGVWVYLLVFVVIMLASTIVGWPIPDNTFLFLAGAVAIANGLSMVWLFVVAVGGGFAGYEINYWCGKWFGLAICRGVCPTVLHDKNVRNALDAMDRFGLAALIFSRFMPVLNLPSFIAGVNGMEYRRYVGFNLMSSVVWCGSLLILGYYFGSITIISAYISYLTDLFMVILVVSIIIVIVMFVRDYAKRKCDRVPE